MQQGLHPRQGMRSTRMRRSLPCLLFKDGSAQTHQSITQGTGARQHLLLQTIVGEIQQEMAARQPRQALHQIKIGFIDTQQAITPDIGKFAGKQRQQQAAEEMAARKILGAVDAQQMADQPVEQQHHGRQQAR